MKPLFTLFLIAIVVTSNGQLIKPTTGSQSFSFNFEKIVQSFRNNFHSIQGEAIPSEKELNVFRSTMTVPGTLNAVIYRFHSKKDSSASWQAMMYQGEEYKSALKLYKSTCRQVNKLRVGGIGIFKGDYEEPDANLRFAGSSFKLETDDKTYRNFFAEVEMVLNADEEWEVRLNLVRKKDDEDMF